MTIGVQNIKTEQLWNIKQDIWFNTANTSSSKKKFYVAKL